MKNNQKCNVKFSILKWLTIITFILLFLTIQVQARNGGVTDMDLDIAVGSSSPKYDDGASGLCGNQCHTDPSPGTITISASPCCNYTRNMAGINITVNLTGATGGEDVMSIKLLNNSPLNGNIKKDGWVITQDSNNNPTKYNHNQYVYAANMIKNWTVTSPNVDGRYYMLAQARHGKGGGNGNYFALSSVLTLIVDVTPPSVISNTNNLYVKTGTVLTLNATITDLTGVKNATVNVSGINSTINEAILTNQSGYWINSTIIADRGETALQNLTITAYDNLNNGSNNSVNMTVGIDNTAPIVTSNTNNVYVSNGSFLTLNATITDTFSGVKNVTVNVSALNSTKNEVILTLSGGYWLNTTIRADRGDTGGFKNLTITAYDNASNINVSINMTVGIDKTPPVVTSNTNNLNVSYGSLIILNATITDLGSGVKNATVNVSSINTTINNAVLTFQDGYWINSTIITDRGDTGGLKNLTITAYDNVSNINSSVNMTVGIIKIISSWGNNWTNNNNLSIEINLNEVARFNITSSYSPNYQWKYDGVDQFNNAGNFTYQFLALGAHYINATVNYSNLIEYKNWSVLVETETIDVTLSNLPIDFGNVSSGTLNISSLYPLNVTIQNTTNVYVNITLKGTDFVSEGTSFGVGNMTYSNSSTGMKKAMATSFAIPEFTNWINLPRDTTYVRSIYFWLTIPQGQEPGDYGSNITIQVEKYNS